mmetsp:Transcript_36127/g.100930  ORF Transcript_36127/g.100930 Transcript_36127/m.100930 type:complete len:223 (-) Transcript_36127:29-697(-)
MRGYKVVSDVTPASGINNRFCPFTINTKPPKGVINTPTLSPTLMVVFQANRCCRGAPASATSPAGPAESRQGPPCSPSSDRVVAASAGPSNERTPTADAARMPVLADGSPRHKDAGGGQTHCRNSRGRPAAGCETGRLELGCHRGRWLMTHSCVVGRTGLTKAAAPPKENVPLVERLQEPSAACPARWANRSTSSGVEEVTPMINPSLRGAWCLGRSGMPEM